MKSKSKRNLNLKRVEDRLVSRMGTNHTKAGTRKKKYIPPEITITDDQIAIVISVT